MLGWNARRAGNRMHATPNVRLGARIGIANHRAPTELIPPVACSDLSGASPYQLVARTNTAGLLGLTGFTGVVSTVEAFMVEVSTVGDPMAAGSMAAVTEDAGNC